LKRVAREVQFKQTIEADPTNATNLGAYALFLSHVRHDPDGAEALFRRAIDIDPAHATNLGAYARFLESVRHDPGAAETYYERAVDADPTNVSNLGHYALMLRTMSWTYRQRAAEAAAHRSNFLVFAHDLDRFHGSADQMEAQLALDIESDPLNPISLGTYAYFLKTIRGDRRGAKAYFRRAIEADPTNVSNLIRYSILLDELSHAHFKVVRESRRSSAPRYPKSRTGVASGHARRPLGTFACARHARPRLARPSCGPEVQVSAQCRPGRRKAETTGFVRPRRSDRRGFHEGATLRGPRSGPGWGSEARNGHLASPGVKLSGNGCRFRA
jgi:TPR repeat protein